MGIIERLKRWIFGDRIEVKSTGLIVEKYDFQKPVTAEEKQAVQKYYDELHEEMLELSKRDKIVHENLQDIQIEYEEAINQRLDFIRKLIQSRESKFDYFSWKIKGEDDETSIMKTALEVRLEAEYFRRYKEELEEMLRDIELKTLALEKLSKHIPKVEDFWRWAISNEIVGKIRRQKIYESISRMEIKWSEVKAIKDVFEMYVSKLEALEKSVDGYILSNPESTEIITSILQERCMEFDEYRCTSEKIMGENMTEEILHTDGISNEILMQKIIEDSSYMDSKFTSEEFAKEFISRCERELGEAKEKLDIIYMDVPMWVKRLRVDRNKELIKQLQPEIKEYREMIEKIKGIRRTLLYVRNQGIAQVPDDLINTVFYISAYVDEIEQEMNPKGDEYIECFFDTDPEEYTDREELFYLRYIDELKEAIEKQHKRKEDEKAIQQLLSIICNESGDNSIFSSEDRWKISALMLLRKSGQDGLNYFFENYRMMLPKNNDKWPSDEELTGGRRITLKDFLISYCRYERNPNLFKKLRGRAKENVGTNDELERIINLFFKLNSDYSNIGSEDFEIINNMYGGMILNEFFQKAPKYSEETPAKEMSIYGNNPDYLEVPPEDNIIICNYNWATGFNMHSIEEITSFWEHKEKYVQLLAGDSWILADPEHADLYQRIFLYGENRKTSSKTKSKAYDIRNIPYFWSHSNKLEIEIETELNRRERKNAKQKSTTVNVIRDKYGVYLISTKRLSELIAKFAVTLEVASKGKINAQQIRKKIFDNLDSFLTMFETDMRYNESAIIEKFISIILLKETPQRGFKLGKYNDGLEENGYTYGLNMFGENGEITANTMLSEFMNKRFREILSECMPINELILSTEYMGKDKYKYIVPLVQIRNLKWFGWNVNAIDDFVKKVFPDMDSLIEYLEDPLGFKKDLFTEDFLKYLESRHDFNYVSECNIKREDLERFLEQFKERRKEREL